MRQRRFAADARNPHGVIEYRPPATASPSIPYGGSPVRLATATARGAEAIDARHCGA